MYLCCILQNLLIEYAWGIGHEPPPVIEGVKYCCMKKSDRATTVTLFPFGSECIFLSIECIIFDFTFY